jgi:Fe-S-cluster-containing dehydrogenase component
MEEGRNRVAKKSLISKFLTRRSFLLSSAAASASMFLIGASTSPATAQRPTHAILVDVSKCIACMRCVVGCETYHRKYENLSNNGTAYTRVAVIENLANVPELCLHCSDSPCTSVCITHALTQLDYGAVVYDRDKCIGCLLCVNQCPFGSITYDPVDKKIYKCTMCNKAVEEGKNPYCVQVCPTGTRTFGLYEDKLAEGMKLAEQKQGVLLYPRDTGTLYVVPGKAFEKLADKPDVTVIKNGYPSDSRLVADLLKYSRLAWIPVALGVGLYVAKWTRHESDEGS